MQYELKKIFMFFTLAVLSSCEVASVKSESSPNEKSLIYPVLVDFPQNGEIIATAGQLESLSGPLFISSTDTIKFGAHKPIRQSYYSHDSIEYSTASNLSLFVDVNQSFAGKFRERRQWDIALRYLDENGKEIPQEPYQAPYDSVMKFAVFIFNESDSLQALEHQDGKLVFIQEALNKDGKWKGIEYFEYSGCGNSYGLNFLQPKEFLLFSINKYSGNFKTKLRVRLKTNGKILLSNEFLGSINEGQFKEVENNGSFGWNRYLTETH